MFEHDYRYEIAHPYSVGRYHDTVKKANYLYRYIEDISLNIDTQQYEETKQHQLLFNFFVGLPEKFEERKISIVFSVGHAYSFYLNDLIQNVMVVKPNLIFRSLMVSATTPKRLEIDSQKFATLRKVTESLILNNVCIKQSSTFND